MVFIRFFLEVFKRIQRFGTLLYLVKDNQGFLRLDFLAADHGEQLNDTVRILVRLKDGLQLIFLVKVEVDEVIVVVLPERFHQPGLADLPCALEHHGLALGAVFPTD